MTTSKDTALKTVCIGAGPAGLTAAYLLSKKGEQCAVFEKDHQYVGGISRTVEHEGFRFDIGGHRFFSKSQQVENLWDEILGDDFIERPRKSRIFYRGKFFSYPLKPFEALFKLGLIQSFLSLLSYVKVRLCPIKKVNSFQDWVTNQFGSRLFRIFFKTYTEKVWGMSCSEISADWAAQRIKGLSLVSAIKNALLPQKPSKDGEVIKTLITTFRYPRLGPGMMWETAEKKIKAQGSSVQLGANVTSLKYDSSRDQWWVGYELNGETHDVCSQHIISSMPVRELVHVLSPKPPQHVIDAADALRYRDFLIVALMVGTEGDFDDNWIYIHDPSVKVGRIQNFRSWSPEMIPKAGMNCYGMEYFCFENDGLWSSSDDDLIELAKQEMTQIGLVNPEQIVDGYVIRQPKAYPVYDEDYKTHVSTIRHYLEETYPTLHLVGRNGMHKYNNQDHAMMTAMLTVENILADNKQFNVWEVNEDAQYHEGGQSGTENDLTVTERLVPQRKKS